MKRLLLVLACTLLCACSNTINLEQKTAESISAALKSEVYSANISKPYYSFYLEPSVGRVSADQTSDVFNINGTKFVMNLNVPEIVNENFFTEVPVAAARMSREPLVRLDGTFKDTEKKERPWKLFVYDVDNSSCAVVLHTYASTFYSVCPVMDVPHLTTHMFKIARSVKVDTESVLDVYTTEDTVVYTSGTIKLFENVAPVNGLIEELFESDNTLGYGESPEENGGRAQIDTDDYDDGDITN